MRKSKEFDFKAWNIGRKEWVKDFRFGGNGWEIEEYKGEILHATFPFENIYLMQYTGLKDKNGQEICEGDLIDGNDEIWQVWWGDQACAFLGIRPGNLEEQYGLIEKDRLIGNEHYLGELDRAYELEIVGNIFEPKDKPKETEQRGEDVVTLS